MTRTALFLAAAPVNGDALFILIGMFLSVLAGAWAGWRALAGKARR